MRRLFFPLSVVCGIALGVALAGPVSAETVTECDRLAADPADRKKVTEGAANEDLFSDAALEACAKAVADDADNMRLAYQYGRLLVLRKKSTQGIPHLTRAAESGYLAAQLVLASGYGRGSHMDGDAGKSYFWFKAAAAQGSHYAQASMGKMLVEGRGVESNAAEGVAMLKGFAAEGNAFADYALGLIHLQGAWVKKDLPQTIKYFESARERDLAGAYVALSLLYMSGEDIKKDIKKVQQILLEGAEAGHVEVQLMLGHYYQSGKFEVADEDAEALRWLCKAGIRGRRLYLDLYTVEPVCK